MKVILMQDVKGQGKKGELINASDGYATNFLLPRKLAVEANESNMNLFNQKKQAAVNKKNKEISTAKELAQKLSQTTVVLKAKAGENGKLFGSITSKDIAEGLKKQQGIELDKRKIILDDTLKTLGSTEFEVKVYEGISAKLKVKVESE
jgi:large subunit ribosomal protein L9